ncbi:hypothetical protein SLEP1_g51820 [Rubroshorea leprosula]|uniref:Uncharacterized protein n=1 Tax=Rubroshorea leprosula TaxID=152421 RepID=A0AAV5M716_9ROSI|nr:hypothetical protein SLEP1_g51820 [Rubroshorea leprosula]
MIKEVRFRSKNLTSFPFPTPCSESNETEKMSSEETLSVEGSEEVRALEYGDIEMTSESSNLERAEEGVGGKVVHTLPACVSVLLLERHTGRYEMELITLVGGSEMVGVEGEGVFITVLEVGSRNERCYDIEADIMSEVRKPARVEERACSAPRDHWMPMYAHYFVAGLRCPIPELLVGLLLDYSIGLTQLASNAMRKAKKANQNKFSLNSDEEEEVGKLVREGGNIVNIMYLTSLDVIEAAELYGPSALSEAEMDKLLSAAGGVAIPKKLRKKSRTSTNEASEGGAGRELVPSTSAGVQEVRPRQDLKRKGGEEPGALQKKKKVVEQEVRGDEVMEFIPWPPPIELDLELSEIEVKGAEVRAPSKGKGLVPPLSFQSSFFDAKNATGVKRFINATFPEVDERQAKKKVLRYVGATVVKHALESASWVNALTQEFVESVKECTLLWRQSHHQQLQEEKDELEKKNKEMQEMLDEVVPAVKQLEDEKDSLSTKLIFEERKRKIFESEREAQEKEIKKVKETVIELKKNVELLSQYPEVDVTGITFGEQEERVEENGESMSADFRSEVKLRWDHDTQGRTIFPPHFDFEFVGVEEEVAEVEDIEEEGNQPHHLVEVHTIPSEEDQPAQPEVGLPPLPAEEEPPQPPLPVEEQPPPK